MSSGDEGTPNKGSGTREAGTREAGDKGTGTRGTGDTESRTRKTSLGDEGTPVSRTFQS